jgi:hypothetical protein
MTARTVDGRQDPHFADALGAERRRAARVGAAEHARFAEQPAREARAHHPRSPRRLLEPHAQEAALHDEEVARGLPFGDEHLLRGERAELDVARDFVEREVVRRAGERFRASKRLSSGLRRARLCSRSEWTGEPANASRPERPSANAAAFSSAGRSKRSANSRAAASRYPRASPGSPSLHLDLGHREERRAAAFVVAQHARQEIAREPSDVGVALRDGGGDALPRAAPRPREHVERRVVVVAAGAHRSRQVVRRAAAGGSESSRRGGPRRRRDRR